MKKTYVQPLASFKSNYPFDYRDLVENCKPTNGYNFWLYILLFKFHLVL